MGKRGAAAQRTLAAYQEHVRASAPDNVTEGIFVLAALLRLLIGAVEDVADAVNKHAHDSATKR